MECHPWRVLVEDCRLLEGSEQPRCSAASLLYDGIKRASTGRVAGANRKSEKIIASDSRFDQNTLIRNRRPSHLQRPVPHEPYLPYLVSAGSDRGHRAGRCTAGVVA